MKKIYCIVVQIALLLWFFLDMTGLYFGDKCLVTRSYKEDGIFFIVYLILNIDSPFLLLAIINIVFFILQQLIWKLLYILINKFK